MEEHSCSAGVICFMVHENEVYFVLGQEEFSRGWDESLKWCEFGGQSKACDNHYVWQTAAREFFEESMGVFGSIQYQLAEQQYAACLTIRQNGRRRTQKTYYLLEVPYQPDVCLQFYIRRQQLKQIATTISRVRIIQHRLSTKNVPVPDFPYFVQQRFRLITDLERIEQTTQGTFVVFVTCQGIVELFEIEIPPDVADDYVRLIYLKNWLDKQIAHVPDNIKSHTILENTWLPMVRKDFLEKENLNIFTVSDLINAPPPWRKGFTFPFALLLEYLTTPTENVEYFCSDTIP
jgi:hypothetical protein